MLTPDQIKRIWESVGITYERHDVVREGKVVASVTGYFKGGLLLRHTEPDHDPNNFFRWFVPMLEDAGWSVGCRCYLQGSKRKQDWTLLNRMREEVIESHAPYEAYWKWLESQEKK